MIDQDRASKNGIRRMKTRSNLPFLKFEFCSRHLNLLHNDTV